MEDEKQFILAGIESNFRFHLWDELYLAVWSSRRARLDFTATHWRVLLMGFNFTGSSRPLRLSDVTCISRSTNRKWLEAMTNLIWILDEREAESFIRGAGGPETMLMPCRPIASRSIDKDDFSPRWTLP